MVTIVLALILQEPSVDELLQRLDSDELQAREDAQSALIERGEPILPALEKARTGASAEVAARLADIIHEISWFDHVTWLDRWAVDLREGETLWTLPWVKDSESVLSIRVGHDVCVVVGDLKLCRRSLKDGGVLWKTPLPETPIKLVLMDRTILAIGKKLLTGIDPDTGKETWSSALESDLVYPFGLVAASTTGCVLQTSTRLEYWSVSGKRLWALDKFAYGAVFLDNGDAILTFSDEIARCKASDGSILWRCEIPETHRWTRVRVAGTFVITGADHWGENPWSRCLDVETGKTLWQANLYPVECIASPRKLFIATKNSWKDKSEICCLDTDQWKVVWRAPLAADGAALLLQDNNLFVSEYNTTRGVLGLRCLKADTGELSWESKVASIQVDYCSTWDHQNVRLEIVKHCVVLLGDTAGGRFVEVFNAKDGKAGAKWRSP